MGFCRTYAMCIWEPKVVQNGTFMKVPFCTTLGSQMHIAYVLQKPIKFDSIII